MANSKQYIPKNYKKFVFGYAKGGHEPQLVNGEIVCQKCGGILAVLNQNCNFVSNDVPLRCPKA